ncbi:STN domain-containing protein [Telmatospirillum siberiense]|uniref:TonB-dependent outer membrane receptor n=1 Tax=Telmatospirillum siberiense TaxID=382514 RepID=A0A2N3PQC0_9PROT|nr:STN domain-containing protein [Telmatospirillum siberiense]PKU22596.1 TonB-dependent outer membrane receptor [Telmatospirillum siberiense]
MLASLPAGASEDEMGRRAVFQIPAQPLADALNAFGETTHIPMFVDSELIRGRRSSEVAGSFSSLDALREMLDGTGLTARSVDGKGFTLMSLLPSSGPDTVARRSIAREFERYSAAIQVALHEALCRHRETRPGTYRSLIRLWIGETGRVTRSDLLTTTGDSRRDVLLAGELQALAVGEPPPPGLRQPVTLLLQPSAASAADYCLLAQADGGDD